MPAEDTRTFIVRDGAGVRFAGNLFLGDGVTVRDTAAGAPELTGIRAPGV